MMNETPILNRGTVWLDDDNARHMRVYFIELFQRLRFLEAAGLFTKMKELGRVKHLSKMKESIDKRLKGLGLTSDGLREMSLEDLKVFVEQHVT